MVPTRRLIGLLVLGAPLWSLGAFAPAGAVAAALYLGLLVAGALSQLRRVPGVSQLSVRRELPTRFSFDEETSIQLIVTNPTDVPLVGRLRDELPEALEAASEIHPIEIPAKGEVRLAYTVRPVQRGPHIFGDVLLRVSTAPGLLERQLRFHVPDRIKIYPRFRGLEDYQLLARIAERDEVVRRPRQIRGAGTDYESLRAYTPGEDLRNVDWKASARRGSLVSRIRQVERGQQLAVLIDSGRMMQGTIGGQTRLDHAMNATVMLGYVAQQRGDAIAVACFSNRIESFMPTVRGPAIVPRILEAVYAIQLRPVESDYWQVIAEAMSLLRRRSLVIMLTDVLDPAGSAGLLANLRRAAARHLVLCVVLTEPRVLEAARIVPATTDQAYHKAAACDVLRRRRLALEHMRSHGLLVLETDPEHLTIRLVQRYLEIRQADLQ